MSEQPIHLSDLDDPRQNLTTVKVTLIDPSGDHFGLVEASSTLDGLSAERILLAVERACGENVKATMEPYGPPGDEYHLVVLRNQDGVLLASGWLTLP